EAVGTQQLRRAAEVAGHVPADLHVHERRLLPLRPEVREEARHLLNPRERCPRRGGERPQLGVRQVPELVLNGAEPLDDHGFSRPGGGLPNRNSTADGFGWAGTRAAAPRPCRPWPPLWYASPSVQ